MDNDRNYFMRRAAQERSAATRAEGKARLAHEHMADRYRTLINPAQMSESNEAGATS